MEWFKTNGILDEHILRGIAKYGISRTEKVATLVYLAGGTVFILLKVHVLAVFYFIVGLFLVLYQMVLFKRITIHDNLKNMQLVMVCRPSSISPGSMRKALLLLTLPTMRKGKYCIGIL